MLDVTLALSNTEQWQPHVEKNVDPASKILGIMRKLKYFSCRNVLNQMDIFYLLPVLVYASVVWDGYP